MLRHARCESMSALTPARVMRCRQFVHAPIDQADQAAEQIGAAVRLATRRFRRCGAAGADQASRDQERRDDVLGLKHVA